MIKETYLPFVAEMVKALLDGRKRVTHRHLIVPESWDLHDHRKLEAHTKKGNGAR